MISTEKCKRILDTADKKYIVEEITLIREALYNLATLEYCLFTENHKEHKENADMPPTAGTILNN